jgi:cytochrome c oxidase cbb3-type subunit III
MDNRKRIDTPTGTETVGHEWDGIEELNTPLPRWWLWTFYGCIAFSVGYCVMYPAWPLINSATAGTLGWSSRGDLAHQLAADAKIKAPIMAALTSTPVESFAAKPELMKAAIAGGASAFKVHCVQCHGSDAAGTKGYPNLNDDDWLWGGDVKAIEYTLLHGIRNPDVAETRASLMPAFGKDGILTADGVQDAVSYVRTLSGQESAGASSQRGAALYQANCAVCHGPAGKGLREFGAPNLTDGIWLYGGDRETLTQTITYSRKGVMPAWGKRLDPVTIKMLATYVHSRGGGEAAPASAMQAATNAAESPVAQAGQ